MAAVCSGLAALTLSLICAPAFAWGLPGVRPPEDSDGAGNAAEDAASLSPPTLRLEAGGGIHAAFDGDHRDRYGREGSFSLALSAPVGSSFNRAFVEVGYWKGDGLAFGGSDPTFEEHETSYSVVPLVLGLRLDTASGTTRSPVGASIGLAFAMAIVSVDVPFRKTEDETSQGFVFDLRPEVALPGPWSVWTRAQFALMSAVGGDGAGYPELDLTGSGLQLGIAWDIADLGR